MKISPTWRREGKRLHEETDYAVMAHFGASIFEWSQLMRGYANAMADMAGNRKMAAYLMDCMTEIHLENLRKFLDAVGDYIDIIVMGDDMGMQSGPWISPRTYRELIKPRHKKIYGYVHDHRPDIFVFLHCCGSIYASVTRPDRCRRRRDQPGPNIRQRHGARPA